MPIVINTKEFVDEVRKLCRVEGWCSTAEEYLRDDLGLVFEPKVHFDSPWMILADGAPETLDAQKVAEVIAKARAEYPTEAKDGLAKLRERFGLPDLHVNDTITVTITLTTDDLVDVGWNPSHGPEEYGWRSHVRDALGETDHDTWKIDVVPDPRRVTS